MSDRKNVDVSFDDKYRLEIETDSFGWIVFCISVLVIFIFGPIRGCTPEGTEDLFRQNHETCEQLCQRASHMEACYTHCMKEYRFDKRLP